MYSITHTSAPVLSLRGVIVGATPTWRTDGPVLDTATETTLIAKMTWSAAIVIGLSLVAERVSPRIAGILAGAPLGTFFVYLFVGLDQGPQFVVASVPHAIAGFSATCAFVVAYTAASARLKRLSVIGSAAIAVAAFLIVATLLVRVPFNIVSAIVVNLSACALSYWWLRSNMDARIEKPVRLTVRLLALRGGLAAVFVAGSVTVAQSFGTRWTGLATGFPMTMLPTLLILHTTYGVASTHALLRSVPLGMASIVIYILVAREAFLAWGVLLGTLAALTASFVYLAVILMWRDNTRAKDQRVGLP